jgi:hypothetical protein
MEPDFGNILAVVLSILLAGFVLWFFFLGGLQYINEMTLMAASQ